MSIVIVVIINYCYNVGKINIKYMEQNFNPRDYVITEMYKGKKIIFANYAGLFQEELLQILDVVKETITSEEEGSVLSLADVTDAHYNNEVMDKLKAMTRDNKPYVKKTAIVGATGLRLMLMKIVLKFSKRNMNIFDNLQKARDWLVEEQ